jgi:hypothetical protein
MNRNARNDEDQRERGGTRYCQPVHDTLLRGRIFESSEDETWELLGHTEC